MMFSLLLATVFLVLDLSAADKLLRLEHHGEVYKRSLGSGMTRIERRLKKKACLGWKQKLVGSSPCDSSPCLNGGTCRNYQKEFICLCPLGYVGNRCELEVLGCWKDKGGDDRALADDILYERCKDGVDWTHFVTYLPDFVIRCAKVAIEKGYSYIGIQYYGECWSEPSPEAENNYNKYGKSQMCTNAWFKNCTTGIDDYCTGEQYINFVYKIHDVNVPVP